MVTDLFSLGVSLVSAAGGAFAAWAAWRSASYAKLTQGAADRITHRQTLREIAADASEVLVEHGRIDARTQNLKLGYQSLFALSGSSSNSNLSQYLARVDRKLEHSSELATDARLFVGGAASLLHSPIDDLDRVANRLHGSLVTLRGYREDLDKEELQVAQWAVEAKKHHVAK